MSNYPNGKRIKEAAKKQKGKKNSEPKSKLYNGDRSASEPKSKLAKASTSGKKKGRKKY